MGTTCACNCDGNDDDNKKVRNASNMDLNNDKASKRSRHGKQYKHVRIDNKLNVASVRDDSASEDDSRDHRKHHRPHPSSNNRQLQSTPTSTVPDHNDDEYLDDGLGSGGFMTLSQDTMRILADLEQVADDMQKDLASKSFGLAMDSLEVDAAAELEEELSTTNVSTQALRHNSASQSQSDTRQSTTITVTAPFITNSNLQQRDQPLLPHQSRPTTPYDPGEHEQESAADSPYNHVANTSGASTPATQVFHEDDGDDGDLSEDSSLMVEDAKTAMDKLKQQQQHAHVHQPSGLSVHSTDSVQTVKIDSHATTVAASNVMITSALSPSTRNLMTRKSISEFNPERVHSLEAAMRAELGRLRGDSARVLQVKVSEEVKIESSTSEEDKDEDEEDEDDDALQQKRSLLRMKSANKWSKDQIDEERHSMAMQIHTLATGMAVDQNSVRSMEFVSDGHNKDMVNSNLFSDDDDEFQEPSSRR